MTRYQKGRILNICSICVLYIFVFKIDIFSSDNNTINNNIEKDNSCTEEVYFYKDITESNFPLCEEYNPIGDVRSEIYNEREEDIEIDIENKSNVEKVNYLCKKKYREDEFYIENESYSKREFNIEDKNDGKKDNEKEYKNDDIIGSFLCSTNGMPSNNKNFPEKNEKQINNINIDEDIDASFEKGKKKDLNKENPYLKRRKRRSKETIEKSIKKPVNIKNSRGRYCKEEINTNNYVPNVDDYSDRRHSKYSRDNIILKIKTLIINEIISFLNSKITEIYKVDEFYSELKNLLEKKSIKNAVEYSLYNFKRLFKKKQILFKLNGKFFLEMKNEDDKNLLNQKIGDILSNEISEKFKIYKSGHNEFIIDGIQWKNEIKEILDLTFLDCVNHFSLREKNENLKGFTDWGTYAKKIEEKNGEDYRNYFYKVLFDFENIVRDCWSRGKNKKNNK